MKRREFIEKTSAATLAAAIPAMAVAKTAKNTRVIDPTTLDAYDQDRFQTTKSISGFEHGDFVCLKWNPLRDKDFRHYKIYRATDVKDNSGACFFLVGTTQSPHFLANNQPIGRHLYGISEVDMMGVESWPPRMVLVSVLNS